MNGGPESTKSKYASKTELIINCHVSMTLDLISLLLPFLIRMTKQFIHIAAL